MLLARAPLRGRMLRDAQVTALTTAAKLTENPQRALRVRWWMPTGRSILSVSSFNAQRQSGVLAIWHSWLPRVLSRVSVRRPAHSTGRRTQDENAAISHQPTVSQSFGSQLKALNKTACQSAPNIGSDADLVQLRHAYATFRQSLKEVADGVMVFAKGFSARRSQGRTG